MVSGVTNASGDVTFSLQKGTTYTCLIDKSGYQNGGGQITPVSNGQKFVFELTGPPTGARTISTNKTSYAQGENAIVTASGFTPNGQIFVGVTRDNGPCVYATEWSGHGADQLNSSGGGTFTVQIGSNVPPGPQKITGVDVSAGNALSNCVQITVTGPGQNVNITVHVEDATTKAPIQGANVNVS
jgi:hypothetical protein